MKDIKQGMMAWSRAGHDMDRLYVIMGQDSDYVYLTDGRLRPLSNPKKKRWKHVQVKKQIPAELQNVDWNNIKDEQVKRAIKMMKRKIKQEV